MAGKSKKKRKTAWGALGPVYAMVNTAHKFRIYKLFKHAPLSFLTGLSHFFAVIFFSRQRKMKQRMYESIAFFTNRSPKSSLVKRLVDSALKNMAILLLDLMLNAPNYDQTNWHKLARFEGMKYLDRALDTGKGAIIVSIHVGEFFHALGGLLLHPNNYVVAAVGNMANRMLFERFLDFPQYFNMYPVAMDKYDSVKDDLVDHLEKNHLVFLMHDIAKGSHLRTRFIDGIANFLAPTPQGAVALHLATGSPIIPLVTIPNGHFLKSRLVFLNPGKIDDAIKKYQLTSSNIAHGEINTAINATLFPYILRFVHCFEEVMTYASRLTDVNIKCPRNTPLCDVFEGAVEKLRWIVKGSYERGRDDASLLHWIDQLKNITQKSFQDAQQPIGVLPNKSIIKLERRCTRDQFFKVASVLCQLARKHGFDNMHDALSLHKDELSNIFNMTS